jgi:hypothetical protein
MAGYSGTPLPQKLGIKEASVVALVGAPAGFDLGSVPTGAMVRTGLGGKVLLDVVLVFVKTRAMLERQLAASRPRIQQAGAIWIAWPKKASGIATDVTEDTVRAVALPTGLVDNKVCAIDEIWSGLRLVIRKELRQAPAPAKPRRRASAR